MTDTYTLLREFADSWVLLSLTLFFLGAIAFAWRPGSRSLHEDAGQVPFRHDDRPAIDEPAPARRVPACGQDCGHCTCDLLPEGTI
ncbi:Cytochrome c oxidase subunit CcoQ [Rubellimicrobium mesophilum DSM 19309]|uniref:Cytochrome c oxidase subunit CcoQ n=1 Tax=Rubellimicrobium mesophilum DSM 19309 TaxID=442562 RepID=A0A017HNE6_9RHOB|nr:CcoQ/FixQ family Cbb3-type cytochrome c oxidase assembly chaperone [Rubellimicrobium mesophilum]EYD75673.1 Cytochrome c oxidase subunit CcoQ [Rubellimicrobium mesophilum DSM 19309]